MQESELVILLTAAKTQSDAEFDIHATEAIRAGWTVGFVETIRRCTGGNDDDDEEEEENGSVVFCKSVVLDSLRPFVVDSMRLMALLDFTAELLECSTVSDRTYSSTREALGGNDAVLVEVVSIVGYYTMVAYTLNVFNLPSRVDQTVQPTG